MYLIFSSSMTQKGKKYADFLPQNEKLQVECSKIKDLSTKPLLNSYFAFIGKNLTVWIVYEKWSIYIITMTTSSKIKTRKIPKIKCCSI